MISTIEARRAVHRLRDRGQIQMVVAAGSDRGTNEDRIDEQRRGDFLQPKPGMADLRVTMSQVTDSENPKHNTPQRIISASSSLSNAGHFR